MSLEIEVINMKTRLSINHLLINSFQLIYIDLIEVHVDVTGGKMFWTELI